ncbi:MAG: 2-C-methyl-D-erythritol 4-phosphate cytidylyltransferase [Candidatus Omnitrophota bacterium]|nr:2-C-methyl-D-erythritol 4-phosphate cytidylyltransferase [Candidatus Omnitrophota bacterium]
MKVAAIVPSAGRGTRLKTRMGKPYIKLGSKPVLAHTLIALERNKKIKEIFVAIEKDKIGKASREIIRKYGIKKARLLAGGRERMDSVYNALRLVSGDIDYVLIHDGVRPFVTDQLIEDLLKAAAKFNASVAGVPVKPTLKFASEDRFIKYTPPRQYFWEAQTPQVFKKDLIMKAYEFARKKNIRATDDAMLVEKIGVRPKIVMGSYSNIKITTREDLELARIILKRHK